MGAQAEASHPTKPRPCAEPAHCIKYDRWINNNIIDIASLEELFQHDGPLLAEDCERYHFENDAAIIPEPEPVAQPQPQASGPEQQEKRVEQHVKKVMEQIKARQQDEVRQRFDCAMHAKAYRVDLLDGVDFSEATNDEDDDPDPRMFTGLPLRHTQVHYAAPPSSDQIVKETMASLQAAKERMELRTRATAALQAATARAAKTTAANAEITSTEAQAIPTPQTKRGTIGPGLSKAPVSRSKDQPYDVLQVRIQKALAAAQIRHASEAA